MFKGSRSITVEPTCSASFCMISIEIPESLDIRELSWDSRLSLVDSRISSLDIRLSSVDPRLSSVDSRELSGKTRLSSVDSRELSLDSDSFSGVSVLVS